MGGTHSYPVRGTLAHLHWPEEDILAPSPEQAAAEYVRRRGVKTAEVWVYTPNKGAMRYAVENPGPQKILYWFGGENPPDWVPRDKLIPYDTDPDPFDADHGETFADQYQPALAIWFPDDAEPIVVTTDYLSPEDAQFGRDFENVPKIVKRLVAMVMNQAREGAP